jgi:outer membrane protein insertion porin family
VLALCLVTAAGLPSCNVTRAVPEGRALYKDSRVAWPDADTAVGRPPEREAFAVEVPVSLPEPEPSPEDILADLGRLGRQRPNKRFLGVLPFRLWLHQRLDSTRTGAVEGWLERPGGIGPLKRLARGAYYADSGRSLRDWARESIGEPPVYYDSAAVGATADRMAAYLANKGYFHARVGVAHEVRRRQATAAYTVRAGPRYYLQRVRYDVEDSLLRGLVSRLPDPPVLRPGTPYDLDRFKAERVRVRDTLLNNGYYGFDRNYVEFALDSTVGPRLLDVYVRVLPPLEGEGHDRWRMGRVFAYPDYRPGRRSTADLDTVVREGVEIVYRDLQFKPSTLLDAISVRPGGWYVADDHQRTQRRLSELGAFRFVSVQYREREEQGQRVLDTYIRLQPSKKQSVSVELNANTNFNALIGSDLDFNYRNRNLFRNADLFTLNLSSGLETQFAEGERFLRNLDFSGAANLDIPKLLLPRAWRPQGSAADRRLNPRTNFAARYIYTRRLAFYTLHSTALSMGYAWQRDRHQAHRVAPVDITLVVPTELTDSFRTVLDGNFLLQQSFQSTIIPAASYTYVYADNALGGGRHGVLFRGSGELAGNLINLGWSAIRQGEHTLGGIALAQYARATADARYYWNFAEEQSLALRLMGGVGVPYGNSDALPYVRQFFAGGPSSVRAWRVRRLGPGSFSLEDSTVAANAFVDQTGDIQLEANIEYRFPIYQFLEGALFVDAGNIWLLREDPERPGGRFTSRFYRDVAIGTGLGLRLDFDFFIVRADMGLRVRDPSRRGPDAWLWRDLPRYLDEFNQVTEFNIAIGYPF